MSLPGHFEVTSMSLRCHFHFTSMSLRVHFDFTQIPLIYHFDVTSISLRFHFNSTWLSHRSHFGVPSISLRYHVGVTSISLRVHLDYTSITLRSHFDITLSSRWFHFDFTFTSMSLGYHFDSTSSSLWPHFDFAWVLLRCHFNFTSIHIDLNTISRWFLFDSTSIVCYETSIWLRIHLREKGTRHSANGNMENSGGGETETAKVRSYVFSEFPLYNPTARTNETKRNDFPVGLTPQPLIHRWIHMGVHIYFLLGGHFWGHEGSPRLIFGTI